MSNFVHSVLYNTETHIFDTKELQSIPNTYGINLYFVTTQNCVFLVKIDRNNKIKKIVSIKNPFGVVVEYTSIDNEVGLICNNNTICVYGGIIIRDGFGHLYYDFGYNYNCISETCPNEIVTSGKVLFNASSFEVQQLIITSN